MDTETTPVLTENEANRAAAMRAAGDIIGSEKLAKLLDMSARNLYWLMNGKRTVKDGVLTETRKLLIEHRQRTGDIIALFRQVEALPVYPAKKPGKRRGDD